MAVATHGGQRRSLGGHPLVGGICRRSAERGDSNASKSKTFHWSSLPHRSSRPQLLAWQSTSELDAMRKAQSAWESCAINVTR